MQQAIYTSWRERVGAGEASLLAKTAAELADNTLYLMALRLLWPLLSSDQQLEVQQWFRRYARTSGPSGAASASSSSRPRPLWRCWSFHSEIQGVRPHDASVSFG